MLKRFWREFLVAAVVAALAFFAIDFLGDLVLQEPEELKITASIMVFSIAVIVVPGLVGGGIAGVLVGKREKSLKARLFVPALGAAIGTVAVMALGLGGILFLTEAGWQAQLDELGSIGVDFFAEMTLEEYKAMVLFSALFGMLFMALINFAIGLVGGYLGSMASGKEKNARGNRKTKG